MFKDIDYDIYIELLGTKLIKKGGLKPSLSKKFIRVEVRMHPSKPL